MDTYVVLYHDLSIPYGGLPVGFVCEAVDIPDAQRQCEIVYPNCVIAWTFPGDDIQQAIDEYVEVVNLIGDSF